MSKPKPEFEILNGDGTGKDEYIDFFRIPYWTNDHRFDTVERHYQWVGGLDPDSPDQLWLVLWANREKPTLAELKAEWQKDFGDEEDEVA